MDQVTRTGRGIQYLASAVFIDCCGSMLFRAARLWRLFNDYAYKRVGEDMPRSQLQMYLITNGGIGAQPAILRHSQSITPQRRSYNTTVCETISYTYDSDLRTVTRIWLASLCCNESLPVCISRTFNDHLQSSVLVTFVRDCPSKPIEAFTPEPLNSLEPTP